MALIALAFLGTDRLEAGDPPKKTTAHSAGWRAFKDPKTGKLREPTREEASKLSHDAARKGPAPVDFEVIVHPNGMKSVDLKGAFHMSLVARRNPDGSISYTCRRETPAEK